MEITNPVLGDSNESRIKKKKNSRALEGGEEPPTKSQKSGTIFLKGINPLRKGVKDPPIKGVDSQESLKPVGVAQNPKTVRADILMADSEGAGVITTPAGDYDTLPIITSFRDSKYYKELEDIVSEVGNDDETSSNTLIDDNSNRINLDNPSVGLGKNDTLQPLSNVAVSVFQSPKVQALEGTLNHTSIKRFEDYLRSLSNALQSVEHRNGLITRDMSLQLDYVYARSHGTENNKT